MIFLQTSIPEQTVILDPGQVEYLVQHSQGNAWFLMSGMVVLALLSSGSAVITALRG